MGVQKCCGQESCGENNMPPKNDRRCQLINEVKSIIGNIEQQEKAKPQRLSRRPDKVVPGMRDLEDECAQWRKRRECTPPLITTIALHETRPTSEYTNMRHENSSQVTYIDATKEGDEWRKVPPAPWDLPRSPSQELRMGSLYSNCRCLKRDGLQYDCPRWECGGRPECVAVNPGPCCIPSQWPKPIRGDKRFGNRLSQRDVELVSFEGRQLKTGPLNPEICIPLDSPTGPSGYPPGDPKQDVEFITGGRVQQGMMAQQVVSAGSAQQAMMAQQGGPKGCGSPPQQGMMGVMAQGGPAHGRSPLTDVVVVLDLADLLPQQPPPPQQMRVAPQEMKLTGGPGVTCCCRPLK